MALRYYDPGDQWEWSTCSEVMPEWTPHEWANACGSGVFRWEIAKRPEMEKLDPEEELE